MIRRLIISALLLIISPLAFADTLDLSLNNNAVAFNYITSAAGLMPSNADLQVGFLYNDSMNTLANAGLIVKADNADSTDLTLAVGTKVLVGMIKNYAPGTTQNVAALVIGGELSFTPPAAKQLTAAIYYFAGPHITTFGDADRSNQWGAHVDFEVNPGTKVYAEYRETNFGIAATGQTATVDSGLYVGLKLSF